jgi:HK97 family phage prohead protease
MPLDIIQRHLTLDDLSIQRSTEGRTIVARALTYGVPYEVSDDGGRSWYHEVWRTGVFDKSIVQRSGKIPMMMLHDRRRPPIGVMLGVEVDAKAFVFRSKVSNTRDGDEALELVNDGVLTGVSVGARPLNNRRLQGGVERVEAALIELSLCTPSLAQMGDGTILAVRSLIDVESETIEPVIETDEDDDEKPTTPDLDQATAYLADLVRP